MVKECYMEALHGEAFSKPQPVKELDVCDELAQQRGQLVEDLMPIVSDKSDPTRMV